MIKKFYLLFNVSSSETFNFLNEVEGDKIREMNGMLF